MWLIDGCYAPDFMVIILVHMYKGLTHPQITNFARCGQFRFRYIAVTDNLKLFIELNIATKVHYIIDTIPMIILYILAHCYD